MTLYRLRFVFFLIVMVGPAAGWGLSPAVQEQEPIVILDEIGTPMVYVTERNI